MNPKIPPVVVVLVCALLMWLLHRFVPVPGFSFPGVYFVAALIALAGVAVCALGVTAFRRARTTVNPLEPGSASALVVAGIYQYTRNPMYLGFALLLLAWGIFLRSLPALLVVPAFVVYMNRWQIGPEERALEMLFGAEYRSYVQSVRRWV